jgi:hypothetical protein
MRKKLMGIALAGALALPMLGISTAAFAGGNEVIRTGSCSASSDWKLKVKPDNGGLEVEFEVDQNVSGDTWRVRMRHDGELFFKGKRTTRGASGSFDISVREPDHAGTDSFVAKARNLSTDEVCVAKASI